MVNENSQLPDHLGGHLNKTHTDRGTLLYLKEKYDLKNFIDVGCGIGDMVEIASKRGMKAIGVDGDHTLEPIWRIKNIKVTLHDYATENIIEFYEEFDLGWSVEFLEHVEEKFMANYMKTFQLCKYLVVTAAPPGTPGHHHVNCQPQEYWVEKFNDFGFIFEEEETKCIRKISTMKKPFMQQTGMFLRRQHQTTE